MLDYYLLYQPQLNSKSQLSKLFKLLARFNHSIKHKRRRIKNTAGRTWALVEIDFWLCCMERYKTTTTFPPMKATFFQKHCAESNWFSLTAGQHLPKVTNCLKLEKKPSTQVFESFSDFFFIPFELVPHYNEATYRMPVQKGAITSHSQLAAQIDNDIKILQVCRQVLEFVIPERSLQFDYKNHILNRCKLRFIYLSSNHIKFPHLLFTVRNWPLHAQDTLSLAKSATHKSSAAHEELW